MLYLNILDNKYSLRQKSIFMNNSAMNYRHSREEKNRAVAVEMMMMMVLRLQWFASSIPHH